MFLLKEDGGNRTNGLTRKEQSSFVTLRRSLYCTYKIKHEVHVVSFWLTILRRLCFSRTLEDKKKERLHQGGTFSCENIKMAVRHVPLYLAAAVSLVTSTSVYLRFVLSRLVLA